MADVDIHSPYATIAQYFAGVAPTYVPPDDQPRIQAYQAYEDLYWGNPEAYKLVMRGTDGEEKPIYVPSARSIVETLNRYVAKGFGFAVDPDMGTPQQQLECIKAFQNLFDRERILSKFANAKRFGIMKGDWGFHITADPNKPEGSRMTITAIDPATLYKITDDDNVERTIGYQIASVQVADDGAQYMLVTEYTKSEARGEEPGGPIFSHTFTCGLENWWDPEQRQTVVDILPETPLDPRITALPVYHIPNFEQPGYAFGTSELRGLEILTTAINQAVSDEDVTLALQGLGMYATDAGAPVDEEGNAADWNLGPGRVVEHAAGRKFNRVQGVTTVLPFQDHINYLHGQLRESSGVPAVAMGQVEVSTAESGIALALKMGPILSRAEEKDLIIRDVMGQFLYDLRTWFAVYEGMDFTTLGVSAAFGEKLPMDRKARMAELQALFDGGIISGEYFRKVLTTEFGFDFPGDMANQIVLERAQQDPYAERRDAEGTGEDFGGDENPAGATGTGTEAE